VDWDAISRSNHSTSPTPAKMSRKNPSSNLAGNKIFQNDGDKEPKASTAGFPKVNFNYNV
jgi:hypothetical protein